MFKVLILVGVMIVNRVMCSWCRNGLGFVLGSDYFVDLLLILDRIESSVLKNSRSRKDDGVVSDCLSVICKHVFLVCTV